MPLSYGIATGIVFQDIAITSLDGLASAKMAFQNDQDIRQDNLMVNTSIRAFL